MTKFIPAALALGALTLLATSAHADSFGSSHCGTSGYAPTGFIASTGGLYSDYGPTYGSDYGTSNYGTSQCRDGFCGTADALGCRDGNCDLNYGRNSAYRPTSSSWATGYRGTSAVSARPASMNWYDYDRPMFDRSTLNRSTFNRSTFDRPAFDRHSGPTYTGYGNSHFGPRDRFGY